VADIQTQLPVKLTDGTNTVAITAQSAAKVDGSAVTQPISGTVSIAANQTVTIVPSGTQTITGTVTTNADSTVAPGTAPSRALLGGLVYNTAAPAPTNGQTLALQGDSAGDLPQGKPCGFLAPQLQLAYLDSVNHL
jgi:hypothetical protein